MKHRSSLLTFLVALVLGWAPLGAAEIHVAPDGTPEGDGSVDRPLDIETVFGHRSPAGPGDTVRLAAGTYRGDFDAYLAGTEDEPVTVRPAHPGDRVTLLAAGNRGAALTVHGDWSVWQGLVVACDDPERIIEKHPVHLARLWRPSGIIIRGRNAQVRNCIVHDCGHGIEAWGEAREVEIGGCIVYNNGWQGAGTGYGNGIFARNHHYSKRIVDNVLANQFAFGLRATSGIDVFAPMTVSGNVGVNNGSISRDRQYVANFQIGTVDVPIKELTFTANHAWHNHPSATAAHLGMGILNTRLVMTDNILVGLTRVMGWRSIECSKNLFTSGAGVVELHLPRNIKKIQYTWRNNRYFCPPSDWSAFALYTISAGGGISWDGWRRRTGFDEGSSFSRERPAAVRVVVRPNPYEAGRAHVVIYNWPEKPQVDVDLAGVLHEGQGYEVFDALDPLGEPVVEGTFVGRPVTIPMEARTPARPVGVTPALPPSTGTKFAVLLVRPVVPRPKPAPADAEPAEASNEEPTP